MKGSVDDHTDDQETGKELEQARISELDVYTSEETTDARLRLFTEDEQKRIIRRVDRRLVTTLALLYCISILDRSNLGLAAIGGMSVDLQLVGNRYSIITLVFFITYTLLQPAAVVLLRKAGPRIFLPSIVMLWGVTTIGIGFIQYWYQMIPLRIILGIFESGFFPSCAYLLSCWYPRYELQKRNAAFYALGLLLSAFAGILAYGFLQMNTLGSGASYLGQNYGPTEEDPTAAVGQQSGIAGWRWIFIMDGLLTCILGVAAYFLVVDFPEKATTSLGFLKEKEAAFIVARIDHDRRDAIPERFSISKYFKAALDLKVWGFAALFCLTTTNTYAISLFLPIILEGELKFGLAASECLIAPPYAAAAIVMYAWAYLSDKYRLRSPFILFDNVMGIIGLSLLGWHTNTGVRFFGIFLITVANNANIPCVLTFQANNIRGQWKRALCSATLVGAGGIGGIIGATVFRGQDSPKYTPGIIACLVASVLQFIITSLLVLKFHRANKRADAGGKDIEGLPGFRYTL